MDLVNTNNIDKIRDNINVLYGILYLAWIFSKKGGNKPSLLIEKDTRVAVAIAPFTVVKDAVMLQIAIKKAPTGPIK